MPSNAQLTSGATSSTTVIRKKKFAKTAKIARLIKQSSAIHTYWQSGTQRVQATHYGRQIYATLGVDTQLGLPPYLSNCPTPATVGIMHVGDLAQIQKLISGQTFANYGNAGAIGYAGARFVINKATAKYNFCNSTNGNISIKLYDFVPRQNVTYVTHTNLVPPELAFYTGLTTTFQSSNITQSGSTQFDTTDPATYPGITPFNSSLFCSWYKIIKKREYCLAPGVCCSHDVVVKPNKIFDDNTFLDMSITNAPNTDLVYLRGMTAMTLMIVMGMPNHDTTTPPVVSTSTFGVDITWSKKYEFAFGPAIQRSVSLFTDIPTVPTTGAFKQVPEAQGASVTTAPG